ncbi:type IV secretory system conjugative DNA transfer family protein [Pseudomonadota bacterium]
MTQQQKVTVTSRSMRNFVIISILIGLVLLSCVYIIIASSVILIRGVEYFYRSILPLPITEQIFGMLEEYFKFWKIWVQNKEQLTLTSNNAFTLKLFLSTIIPTGIYGIILFLLRAPIADFRPFKEKEATFGTAHWAAEREIRKAGLRAKKGLLMGRFRGKFLIADGFQHSLLFAPTGSGKGVGFVIPNLLFWTDSVIVHDVKLENFGITSGYRKNKLKNKVFCWNPADPDGITHCYNPLDWISPKLGPMVDDVQKMGNFLLPEQEFWQQEGRSLFVGVVLYLLSDKNRPTTLGEVVRILRSDDVTYNLAVILDTMGNDIHPVSYMNIGSFLQKPDKERGSVLSTAASCLELWANPLVDQATAISHFNLRKFKKEKNTVYVGVTPDNIARLKPLLQVFYQQATSFFTAKLPQKDEPYGVLMMMDEFPTLGKMEQFKVGIAYFRGYRVRLFLIIQDTEQLKASYEESGMNSFLANSTYRITFSANNVDTANLISNLLGNKTINQSTFSRPKYLDLNPGARTLNISETQRALLLPQEVIQLPRTDQIIVIESHSPIRCRKIVYYKDKFFTSKIMKPTFVPTQEPYDRRKHEKKKKGEGEKK